MSSSAIQGQIFNDPSKAADGSAAAPSFAFANSTSTGVYRVSANTLGISTAGVQRVVVDSAGNVGIGTASPGTKFHINGGHLRIDHTNIVFLNPNYDSGNSIALQGYSNVPLVFCTNNTERMRLEASGNLLVGTTSAVNNTHQLQGTTNPAGTPVLYVKKPAVSLNNSGNSYVEFLASGGGFEGYLGVSGTTLQVIDASDSRKKENIRPANYGLKEIKELKPVVYDWKEEFGGEKNIKGFLAQEVKEVLPECVTIQDESERGGFSDSQFLGTATMIPVLVAAIQELEARLAALESK